MANVLIDGFDYIPPGASDTKIRALMGANNWSPSSHSNFPPSTYTAAGRFGFGQALGFNESLMYGGAGFVIPIGAQLTTGFYGLVGMGQQFLDDKLYKKTVKC